jgi:hypothetical protein
MLFLLSVFLQLGRVPRGFSYPRMALASQQIALKNAKAMVAFHWAQEAVPSKSMPSQSNT